MRRNPGGIDAVKYALEELFKKIGPKLAEELKTAYRDSADYRFKNLMEQAKKPQESHLGEFRHWSRGYHSYLGVKQAVVDRLWKTKKIPPHTITQPSWDTLRDYPEAYEVDYSNADRDAKVALENARTSFVSKNLVKFENVLGDRKDVEQILFDVKWSQGVFEGTITVTLTDAIIAADVSLKYVVRRIPKVTPYYQYPMLFRSAVVKGKKYAAPSEEELRTLLGGKPKPSLEEMRKASGICPGSGKDVPADVWKKIYQYMSPSARCTVCGQGVSAQRGVFRSHKTPEATRAFKIAGGTCEMSGQPVPKEVVEAAAAKALAKTPNEMRDYYREKYAKEPFDSMLRMPCTKCGRALEPDRRGNYKEHKGKS